MIFNLVRGCCLLYYYDKNTVVSNFINEPYVLAYITLIVKYLSLCCKEKH